jgi:hypothetical protein
MSHDASSFLQALNRYPPPSLDERLVEEFLEEHGFTFSDLERAKLVLRFRGLSTEINAYKILNSGSSLLRHGQGVDCYVVRAGMQAELLSILDGLAKG